MTLMREMHYSLTLDTAPTSEPVTASEMRAHIRAADPSEDTTVIEPLIKAARQYIEKVTGRALFTQTWKLYLTDFPAYIELRKPPVQSVSGITYIDTDGATQTLSTSVYAVDTAHEPGLVTLKYNQSWPTYRGDINGIVVTFLAGWSTVAAIPDGLKHAIKLLVGHWFMNREAVGTVGDEIAYSLDSLISAYRWGAY